MPCVVVYSPVDDEESHLTTVTKSFQICTNGGEDNKIYLRFQMPATVSGWTLYEASVALQIICNVGIKNMRIDDTVMFMSQKNHVT